MNVLPGWVTALGYLAAAVCFILALKGLSSPRTAVRGNRIGAAGAALAVLVVFLSVDFPGLNLGLAVAAVIIGCIIAVPVARRVKMTDMPQLVALFNGVGGGAAALVGIIELAEWAGFASALATGATAWAILIGAVSLSGSVVTFLKLQGLMTARPVVVPGAPVVMAVTALAGIVLAVLTGTTGHVAYGAALLAVLAAMSLTRGITDAIRYLLVATDRISHGDFEQPVELQRDDELGQIARAVERMRISLREGMERLRRRR